MQKPNTKIELSIADEVMKDLKILKDHAETDLSILTRWNEKLYNSLSDEGKKAMDEWRANKRRKRGR